MVTSLEPELELELHNSCYKTGLRSLTSPSF
jgi:hypothetical protein